MDNPLIAMLFAEDLIEKCLSRLGLIPPYPYRVIPHRETIRKTRLTLEIVEAVHDIILEQHETIYDCYAKLLEKNVKNMTEFRMEVCLTTVYNFPNGYSHVRFLNLCALLVGLSIYYANDGNYAIAGGSAQVLAYVLNFFIYMLKFDPRSSWFDLTYAAQRVRRALAAKTTRTVSTGISTPRY